MIQFGNKKMPLHGVAHGDIILKGFCSAPQDEVNFVGSIEVYSNVVCSH